MENETIIISLGGSLIVPDNIDIDFLKDFKKLILSQVEKGKKFVIITCNILQNPITLNDKINLKTGIIDNVRIVFLSIGSKKYKLNNESWQVVKDLYFFKDGYMTISELNNENKKIIKIDY